MGLELAGVHIVTRQLVDEAFADLVVQGHVSGQDPGELDVGQAAYRGAGVDQSVGVVVSVEHPVLAVWRAFRETDLELGCWDRGVLIVKLVGFY